MFRNNTVFSKRVDFIYSGFGILDGIQMAETTSTHVSKDDCDQVCNILGFGDRSITSSAEPSVLLSNGHIATLIESAT